MNNMKKYYFAYGSNMNHKQMQERCPEAKFICKGILKGYGFVYDGYSSKRNGAVANIVKNEKKQVEGGIFLISEQNEKALDKKEGYPINYYKKDVYIQTEEGETIQALVYLREPQKPGQPSEEYRNTILEGAKNCNLSEEYIKNNL
ncbi:MAG: gamma-glutamylcyclotransferase [Candidatus Goldbacteria bacterium]|nr:gamma-glutamylcyclotransferase [Candidatus Goldiibacteriota bacterium]